MRSLSTRPRGLRSKRAVLALGGVVAVGLGVVNTVGTQAATQDVVTATASQIGSQNLFPVPVPTTMNCSTSGISGFQRANMSWTSMPGVKYSVEQWQNNTTLIWSGVQTSTTYAWYGGFGGGTNTNDRVRIYSINTTTSEKSTGYISWSTHNDTINSTYCSASFGQEFVSCWQQTAGWWTPGALSTSTCNNGVQSLSAQVQALRAPMSTTTTTAPTTTTSSTTTDSPTGDSATTSTTTDPPSTPTSTTTSPPTTSTTSASPTTTTSAPSTTTSTATTSTTTTSTTTQPTTIGN